MLEKMSDFFENRISEYDEHMLKNIDSANEFYPFTAELLPKEKDCHILDLGCGTGLELEFYFKLNPSEEITGIDLSAGMLEVLKSKLADKKMNLNYDTPLTVKHEIEALIEAGFSSVEMLNSWGTTYIIKATKQVFSSSGISTGRNLLQQNTMLETI